MTGVHTFDQTLEHKASVPFDDLGNITFEWHFARGILKPRMSGYELATFLIGHMPSIVPLLGDNPRIQREFQAILGLFATMPQIALDRVLSWVQPKIATQADDLIVLDLNCKHVPERTQTIFAPLG